MAQMSTLGEFLRSRRAALTPDAAGLPDYGERRRVPGLRREELARLAGVSVGYYVRLEQDQSGGVSPAVLEALARALRLGDDERAHLHRLARPAATSRSSPPNPVPHRTTRSSCWRSSPGRADRDRPALVYWAP